jgi:hypothetical protein
MMLRHTHSKTPLPMTRNQILRQLIDIALDDRYPYAQRIRCLELLLGVKEPEKAPRTSAQIKQEIIARLESLQLV